jgi:hypothetical protein
MQTRNRKRTVNSEEWLRTEGVARYDAYHRAPKGLSAAKVFAQLRRHHIRRTQQKLINKGAQH